MSVSQRLTALVEAAKAENDSRAANGHDKKAIQFISITAADFTALTGHGPGNDGLGAFLAIPLRLGDKTEIRFRKPSPMI